jgi:protein-L-isoaspartate O-methyltransferase
MSVVQASELDHHMAGNSQAQANARILGEMLAAMALPPGARILMPGAGTGQILDYMDISLLRPLQVVFTDINAEFLKVLEDRLKRSGDLLARVEVDDCEQSVVHGPFDAILTALLLEHVDWPKAVEAFAALGARWLAFVIQRNEGYPNMVATSRKLAPSIEAFAATAHPHLVPEADLTAHLYRHGYDLRRRFEQSVPDDKTMVGLMYAI